MNNIIPLPESPYGVHGDPSGRPRPMEILWTIGSHDWKVVESDVRETQYKKVSPVIAYRIL